jgi:hypothetical protein
MITTIQPSTNTYYRATNETPLKPQDLNKNEINHLRLQDTESLEEAPDNQLKIVDKKTGEIKATVTIERKKGDDNEIISVFRDGGISQNTLNRKTGSVDPKAYKYQFTVNGPGEHKDGSLRGPVIKVDGNDIPSLSPKQNPPPENE